MIIRLSVVLALLAALASAELYPGPLVHPLMVNQPAQVPEDNETLPDPGKCPTVILRGAPSFTHSVFEELVLNAAETFSDNADVLDPCPECVFSWEACHFLDRSNECIQADLPPPFAAVSGSHDRILHLPLAIANVSCTNASGVPNGINSTCVANPFGDFDVMALSGETYRFQVTVNDKGCQKPTRVVVDIYFEIVEIPPEDTSSSSSDFYCYIHATLDGPRNFTQSLTSTLHFNATAYYTEDSSPTSSSPETSTITVSSSPSATEDMAHWKICPDCTFHWSVCHLTDAGCSENVPAILSSISELNTSEIYMPLLDSSRCFYTNDVDPACQALDKQTYRFYLKAKNDVCIKSKVYVDVTFELYKPGCPIHAVLDAEPIHYVFSPLMLDGSRSSYPQWGQCDGCTYEWRVCIQNGGLCMPVPETFAFISNLGLATTSTATILGVDPNAEVTCPPNIPEDKCFADPTNGQPFDLSQVLSSQYRISLTVTAPAELDCTSTDSKLVQFYVEEPRCYLEAILHPSSGWFPTDVPFIVDATDSFNDKGKCTTDTCSYKWAVTTSNGELPQGFQDLNNADSTTGTFTVDVPAHREDFMGRSFQISVTVTDAVCTKTATIDVHFQALCPDIVPALEGAPGFSQSIFDELTLDGSGSHVGEGCEGCSYGWTACHVLHASHDCVYSDLPIPFVMLPVEHDPVLHLPLALLNVSCANNSNITIGINSSCAANPYGDFDIMALSGETFRFILTVSAGGCQKQTFVDVYFDIVGITSSSIFTEYTPPHTCEVSAVLPPSFSQSVFDTLELDASHSYKQQDGSLCTDCGYSWRVCHLLKSSRDGTCEPVEDLAPFKTVPLANVSHPYFPLVLANVSCNSNVTWGADAFCAVSPNGDFDVMALSDETFKFTVRVTNEQCFKEASVEVYFNKVQICHVTAVLDGAPEQPLDKPLELSASKSFINQPGDCTDCQYAWEVCELDSEGHCSYDNIPEPLKSISSLTTADLSVPLNALCSSEECSKNYDDLTDQTFKFTLRVSREGCYQESWLDVTFRPVCTTTAVLDGAPWFSQSVFDNLQVDASKSHSQSNPVCTTCTYTWTVCHLSASTGQCIATDLPQPFENVSQSTNATLHIPLLQYKNVSCINSTDVIIRDNGTCIGPVGAFDVLALSGETYTFEVTVQEGVCTSTTRVDVFFEIVEVLSESSIPTATPTPIPIPTFSPLPLTKTPTPIPITPGPHTNTSTMTMTLTFLETYGNLECAQCLIFYYIWEDYPDDIFFCELELPWDSYDFVFNDDMTFTYGAAEGYGVDDHPTPYEGWPLLYDEDYTELDEESEAWNVLYLAYDINDGWDETESLVGAQVGDKTGYGVFFVESFNFLKTIAKVKEATNVTLDPFEPGVLGEEYAPYAAWTPSPFHFYEANLYPQCNIPGIQPSKVCSDGYNELSEAYLYESYVCDPWTMQYNSSTTACGCTTEPGSQFKAECELDNEINSQVCITYISDCPANNGNNGQGNGEDDEEVKVTGRVATPKKSCPGGLKVKLGKAPVYLFKIGFEKDDNKKKGVAMAPQQTSGDTRQIDIPSRDTGKVPMPSALILKNYDGGDTTVNVSADGTNFKYLVYDIDTLVISNANLSNANATSQLNRTADKTPSIVLSNVTLQLSNGQNIFRAAHVNISDSNSTGNVTITNAVVTILNNYNVVDPKTFLKNGSTKLPLVSVTSATVNFTGYLTGGGIIIIAPTTDAYAWNPDGLPRDVNVTITENAAKRRRMRALSSKFNVQQVTNPPTLWVCGSAFSSGITVDTNCALGLSLSCDNQGGPMALTKDPAKSVLTMSPNSWIIVTDWTKASAVTPVAAKCVWSATPAFTIKVPSEQMITSSREVNILQCNDVSQVTSTTFTVDKGSCSSICNCSAAMVNGLITLKASCPFIGEPSPSGPGAATGPRGAAPGGGSSIDIGLILGLVLGLVLGLLLLALVAYYYYKKNKEKQLREEEEAELDKWSPEFPEVHVEPITPSPSPMHYPGAIDPATPYGGPAASAPTPVSPYPMDSGFGYTPAPSPAFAPPYYPPKAY